MTCTCGFFNEKKKARAQIEQEFNTNAVSQGLLQSRLEAIFGVKASKLPSANVADLFTLMRHVGMTNVYAITNDSSREGGLAVGKLETLKKLMLADSTADAKILYIKHAADYIFQAFHSKQIQKQFVEMAFLSVHDGLRAKKSNRSERIRHLAILGKLVNAVPMLMVSSSPKERHQSMWDNVIKKEPERQLSPIEQYRVILNKCDTTGPKIPKKTSEALQTLLGKMGLREERQSVSSKQP